MSHGTGDQTGRTPRSGVPSSDGPRPRKRPRRVQYDLNTHVQPTSPPPVRPVPAPSWDSPTPLPIDPHAPRPGVAYGSSPVVAPSDAPRSGPTYSGGYPVPPTSYPQGSWANGGYPPPIRGQYAGNGHYYDQPYEGFDAFADQRDYGQIVRDVQTMYTQYRQMSDGLTRELFPTNGRDFDYEHVNLSKVRTFLAMLEYFRVTGQLPLPNRSRSDSAAGSTSRQGGHSKRRRTTLKGLAQGARNFLFAEEDDDDHNEHH